MPHKPKVHKEVREVIEIAESHGFEFVKFLGDGHMRYRIPEGPVVTIGVTPSKYSWRKNCLAEIKRKARQHAAAVAEANA